MDASAFVASDAEIVERMEAVGITDSTRLTDEQARAFAVLEAVPVYGKSGHLVGYFANTFIALERWVETEAQAEQTIRSLSEGA